MKLTARLLPVWLILSLLLWIPTAFAQPAVASDLVVAVDSVGMTVSDMDRSVDFYSRALSFEKVSDVELWGEPYEQLQGVFISPGLIPLPNDALGFAKGFLVRDPDGHAMQVVER